MPPPAVNTGSPASPSAAYINTLNPPYFAPSKRPASETNKNCSVKGITGTGILINAPSIINVVNRPV